MKSAVLVIDVQRLLFDPDPKPFEAGEVVQRINLVTDWARTSHHTVIFIQHEQANTAMEFESEGWQLQRDLIVTSEDHVIRKTTPDSFLDTGLESILKKEP